MVWLRGTRQALPERQRCPAAWLWRNPRRCLVCSLRRAGCGTSGYVSTDLAAFFNSASITTSSSSSPSSYSACFHEMETKRGCLVTHLEELVVVGLGFELARVFDGFFESGGLGNHFD